MLPGCSFWCRLQLGKGENALTKGLRLAHLPMNLATLALALKNEQGRGELGVRGMASLSVFVRKPKVNALYRAEVLKHSGTENTEDPFSFFAALSPTVCLATWTRF